MESFDTKPPYSDRSIEDLTAYSRVMSLIMDCAAPILNVKNAATTPPTTNTDQAPQL